MIVYGDILFLENVLMGGALIYITGQIFGISFADAKRRLRFAAGCLMCGAFSMVIFVPAKALVTIFMEVCFALAVSCAVYGKTRLMQKAAAFSLVTLFMGGMTMALLLVTGNQGIYTASGIYTGDMKAPLLAIFTALCMMTAKQAIKVISKTKIVHQNSYDLKIVLDGKSLEAKGFLDTGNRLRDPFSGRPAAVAEAGLWKKIEEEGMLRENRMCVIPYQTVGESGILAGVRSDYIEVEGRFVKGCVIARGTDSFDLDGHETGDSRLLLSREMIEGIF